MTVGCATEVRRAAPTLMQASLRFFAGRLLPTILAIASSGSDLASAAADGSTVLALSRGMVKVEVVSDVGVFFVGTGTVVAEELVVTACHVTRSARRIDVLHGGLRHRAISQRSDTEHDLCVLRVPGLDAQALLVGHSASLEVGQEVLAIGFTGGAGLAPSSGTIERLYALDGGWVVQSDAAFSSGASGGGLFDSDGSLVAILLFRMRGPGPQFFAVPVEWLSLAIDRGRLFEPVAPLSGAGPFWQRPLDVLPNFMRANALAAEQRWDDLYRLTEQWHQADMHDPEALYVRGLCENRRARDDAALASFLEATAVDRKHARAWFELGLIYLRLGRIPEARSVIPALLAASRVLGHRLIDVMPEQPE